MLCLIQPLAVWLAEEERKMRVRAPFVAAVPTHTINFASGCIWKICLAIFGGTISLILVFGTLSPPTAQAQTLSTVYSFQGIPDKEMEGDGANPWGSVVRDAQGNLYGTTYSGGVQLYSNGGYGTVFKVDSSGAETVLHRFTNGADGAYPWKGSLLLDASGNLYGTTSSGGANDSGVVFKIDQAGNETVLYAFTGGTDGGFPYAGLIRNAQGNLYGTTFAGGDLGCSYEYPGCGVVFKVNENGKETVLYSFTGTNGDGESPAAGLVLDTQGNLYGTTLMGGDLSCSNLGQFPGCGTVFKVDPTGQETILHTFTGLDGACPSGPVTMDSAGNLYGPTGCNGPNNTGTVYKTNAHGAFLLLYAFPDEFENGNGPTGQLLLDDTGSIYGVTSGGGTNDYGVLYTLTPAGEQTVLHKFTGGSDGGAPYSGVIFGSGKNLYGTTQFGGSSGVGVVYEFTQ